jgi:hypothetical protein
MSSSRSSVDTKSPGPVSELIGIFERKEEGAAAAAEGSSVIDTAVAEKRIAMLETVAEKLALMMEQLIQEREREKQPPTPPPLTDPVFSSAAPSANVSEELYSDLRHGYLLYKQAKQAQKTGAVKTKGYSWDDAITPTLYLSAEDCPDGYCPTPPSEDRRPLDRVRDLFDGAKDTRNALMWLSAGEIATVALIGIAAVLLVFILIKRGIS